MDLRKYSVVVLRTIVWSCKSGQLPSFLITSLHVAPSHPLQVTMTTTLQHKKSK